MKQKLAPCKQWNRAHSPKASTLKRHPAMASCSGTTSTPPKLVVTFPPNHSTLRWHTTMAPCNGTTSTPLKLVVTLPSPHHSTLQWHPAMAPNNGTTSIPPKLKLVVAVPPQAQHTAMVPYDGQQWHHVHCTLQWHPGARSNPPKWFVALSPIGSKNPYSYRYLGKKQRRSVPKYLHYQNGYIWMLRLLYVSTCNNTQPKRCCFLRQQANPQTSLPPRLVENAQGSASSLNSVTSKSPHLVKFSGLVDSPIFTEV